MDLSGSILTVWATEPALPQGAYDPAVGVQSRYFRLEMSRQRRRDNQGDTWRRNVGHAPGGTVAGRPSAPAGGRGRRMVRDLCLSAEIARPGRAGDRDPRRARQARPEIRLFRRIRRSLGQIRRAALAKGTDRTNVADRPLGTSGGCDGAAAPGCADAAARGGANIAPRWRWSYSADRSGADLEPATAAVLRIGRGRHGSAGEGVRGHLERGGGGIAAQQRHEGEADAGDRGRCRGGVLGCRYRRRPR
jgi:hypothetical protein